MAEQRHLAAFNFGEGHGETSAHLHVHPSCQVGSNHMNGGQNYLLLAMDMAKVGDLLSVVKVCTSMLCVK